MVEPNVYKYMDYRQFLSDWYNCQKKEKPIFTHAFICSKLKLKTRSYFGDILKGRRSAGPELFKRLVKLIGFSKAESGFFNAIVNYGNAANSEEKEHWFEQAVLLNNTPHKVIDEKILKFSTKWYFTTIRSYLETCDFKNDYAAASKDLYDRISTQEIKEAIGVLQELGMIAPDERGFLKPVDKILTTGESVKNELLRQYQLSNNEVLQSILRKDEPNTHESTLLTISVSEKGMKRILGRMKQMRKEIMSIVHKDEEQAERVFKLALHAYPESRKSVS